MNIHVQDEQYGQEAAPVSGFVELAPTIVSLEDLIPGVSGQAFELKAWHRAWRLKRSAEADLEPNGMTVEAIDEFQASIPWDQLDQAVFLYEQEGQPLKKGYPLRLYVPNGSSECLNVKSVVRIHFYYDHATTEATYGFKNQVSIEELTRKK